PSASPQAALVALRVWAISQGHGAWWGVSVEAGLLPGAPCRPWRRRSAPFVPDGRPGGGALS
ncbi:hypothetical protein Q7689_29925, partial [Nocardiopsis tropica]|nr:hypothetical protein [Nocardiopsis tropica]